MKDASYFQDYPQCLVVSSPAHNLWSTTLSERVQNQFLISCDVYMIKYTVKAHIAHRINITGEYL